jgi:hypothetical protein
VEGEINQVKLAGHIFSESFVKEKNKWVFSDMNSGLFFSENANGNPYDTIELLHLKASDSLEKASFLCHGKEEIKKRTFTSGTFKILENITTKPNIEIVYLLPRANRYSLPSLLSRYTINPDIAYSPAGSNFKYYLKLAFLALGLVSLIFVMSFGALTFANLIRNR